MIPREEAKKQVVKISEYITSNSLEPVLLIGGLAVNQYVPLRESQDIDLVCADQYLLKVVSEIYGPNEWEIEDRNQDGYRPDLHIRNRKLPNFPTIRIGPKLTEREAYPHVEWSALLDGARPFSYQNRTYPGILVPTVTALAYLKLLSACGRNSAHAEKIRQDVVDIRGLIAHRTFSAQDCYQLIERLGAGAYIEERLQRRLGQCGISLDGSDSMTFYKLLMNRSADRSEAKRIEFFSGIPGVEAALVGKLLGSDVQQGMFFEFARGCDIVREYGCNLLPSDLQSLDYATVVLAALGVREPRSSAHARRARNDRLPAQRRVLVSEAALRQTLLPRDEALDDAGVVIDFDSALLQCLELARRLSQNSQFEIGYLPTSRPTSAVQSDDYMIFDRSAVLVECLGIVSKITDPALIASFTDHFDELWSVAIHGESALLAIQQAIHGRAIAIRPADVTVKADRGAAALTMSSR